MLWKRRLLYKCIIECDIENKFCLIGTILADIVTEDQEEDDSEDEANH
jgi:hypothetical protein